jgi:hypothetical protein
MWRRQPSLGVVDYVVDGHLAMSCRARQVGYRRPSLYVSLFQRDSRLSARNTLLEFVNPVWSGAYSFLLHHASVYDWKPQLPYLRWWETFFRRAGYLSCLLSPKARDTLIQTLFQKCLFIAFRVFVDGSLGLRLGSSFLGEPRRYLANPRSSELWYLLSTHKFLLYAAYSPMTLCLPYWSWIFLVVWSCSRHIVLLVNFVNLVRLELPMSRFNIANDFAIQKFPISPSKNKNSTVFYFLRRYYTSEVDWKIRRDQRVFPYRWVSTLPPQHIRGNHNTFDRNLFSFVTRHHPLELYVAFQMLVVLETMKSTPFGPPSRLSKPPIMDSSKQPTVQHWQFRRSHTCWRRLRPARHGGGTIHDLKPCYNFRLGG